MGKDHARELEEHRRRIEQAVGVVCQGSRKALDKVIPFGAQVVASAAAYSVGITASQLVGFVLKVSCATPVLGPTMGLLGVGLANVLAGQASKHTRKMVVTKSHPLQPGFWEVPTVEDVVLDAAMGACIFKALGGRFSSVMPSNLTKPGALGYESIPARADHSEAYAQPSVKRELARIFKRDGCHHCGSRRPPVIGDHMPPNKMLQGSKDQLAKWISDTPLIGKVFEVMSGGRKRGALQRFYAQCQRCSIRQATAVRNRKRVLVLHLQWRSRSEHLSGVFVGLRYNAPELGGSPGGDWRRRSGKWASLTLAAAGPAGDMTQLVEMRGPATFDLQQLPSVLVPELSSGSLHQQGWASSTHTGSTQAFLQVSPLMESAPASAGVSGWQQQQQQHQDQQQQQQMLYSSSGHGSSPRCYLPSSPQGGAYGSAFGAQAAGGVVVKGAEDRLKHNSSSSGSKAGGLQDGPGSIALLQHQHQHLQRQRGVSGPGDEAGTRLPDQNVLMDASSLQGAALMAPDHARARAHAAFERNFVHHGPAY